MRLTGVELRRARLPLREPFRTAHGVIDVRDVVLVRVLADGTEGWGECAALPAPTYSAEWTGGAHVILRDHLLPTLLRLDDVRAEGVGPALAGVAGHPMAKAAVETAVLDAELRLAGRSLAAHLGGARDRIPAGTAVGLADSVEALLAEVGRRVEEGYRGVKVKVQPGWDLEPLRAMRARFGDELMLGADANGSYRAADVSRLAGLDELGLAYLEQPLPADDLVGSAEVAARLATPVCLDESVLSPPAAAAAIALGACDMINLKPGRVGGVLEARQVHDLCVAAGVRLRAGGMLEAGLGRAAALAVASLPGVTVVGDLAASGRYWAEDLTEPFVLEEGFLPVPSAPGLGVAPKATALDAFTASVERISP